MVAHAERVLDWWKLHALPAGAETPLSSHSSLKQGTVVAAAGVASHVA
jgi:hypothetical protein